MISTIQIFSNNKKELKNFLNSFDPLLLKINNYQKIDNIFYWTLDFDNPLELTDIITSFIDNKNKYSSLTIWITLDTGVFINITENNINELIKYLFERYPY